MKNVQETVMHTERNNRVELNSTITKLLRNLISVEHAVQTKCQDVQDGDIQALIKDTKARQHFHQGYMNKVATKFRIHFMGVGSVPWYQFMGVGSVPWYQFMGVGSVPWCQCLASI